LLASASRTRRRDARARTSSRDSMRSPTFLASAPTGAGRGAPVAAATAVALSVSAAAIANAANGRRRKNPRFTACSGPPRFETARRAAALPPAEGSTLGAASAGASLPSRTSSSSFTLLLLQQRAETLERPRLCHAYGPGPLADDRRHFFGRKTRDDAELEHLLIERRQTSKRCANGGRRLAPPEVAERAALP